MIMIHKKMTVTIIGSTGFIGGYLLRLLDEDPDIAKVRLLVRRTGTTLPSRIEVIKTDFSDPSAYDEGVKGSDAVFCAVGTTNRKVKGDKVAYRKVDYDIPVQAARAADEAGTRQFLLVSSVGASSESRIFYSRLKGEVEDDVRRMHIPSVSVFRPSLLLGKREEHRLGERLAQMFMPPVSFLVPSNFKPIHAGDVARAMVAASKNAVPGFTVYHFREMKQLIQN
jgi:uncharacterized protein YbjT (DUF2867 family)